MTHRFFKNATNASVDVTYCTDPDNEVCSEPCVNELTHTVEPGAMLCVDDAAANREKVLAAVSGLIEVT